MICARSLKSLQVRKLIGPNIKMNLTEAIAREEEELEKVISSDFSNFDKYLCATKICYWLDGFVEGYKERTPEELRRYKKLIIKAVDARQKYFRLFRVHDVN
jgi:hypothetical protein